MSDNLQKTFELAASENSWGDTDSVSGPGSNLIQTKVIRQRIPSLLKQLHIKTMLDSPCGDFFWMKEIKKELSEVLQFYVGVDIVGQLVDQNNNRYGDAKFSFVEMDVTSDPVAKVDLILTRDCFLHLSYKNIYKVLRNYQKSKSTYLLVSTYTASRPNADVVEFSLPGRALNLQKYPFYFPKPLVLIIEGCTEANGYYSDKSLGLWEIKKLNLLVLKVYLFLNFASNFYKQMIKFQRR